MTEQKFAIVKFPDEDDAVDIIPTAWLHDDELYCYYPRVKTNEERNNLVRRCIEADEESWDVIPTVVLAKFVKYENARKKLPMAEVQSNLDDDDEHPPKRARKKRKFLGESSEDEYCNNDDSCDDDMEPQASKLNQKQVAKNARMPRSRHAYPSKKMIYQSFPEPPTVVPGLKKNPANDREQNESQPHIEEENTSEDHLSSERSASINRSEPSWPDIESKFQWLTTSLSDLIDAFKGLKAMVSAIDTKIDKLCMNSEEEHKIQTAVAVSIPAKSFSEFEVLNNAVQSSKAAKIQLETTLKAVAETKVSNTIQNMLQKIFTDELAVSFCLAGKSSEKKVFETYFLYNTVLECTKAVYPAELKVETDARDSMSTWFTQAKHRIKKRKERARKKEMRSLEKLPQAASITFDSAAPKTTDTAAPKTSDAAAPKTSDAAAPKTTVEKDKRLEEAKENDPIVVN
nr:PREDICTED: uncharacterized protein LOC109032761 [Bemisia tabaci]